MRSPSANPSSGAGEAPGGGRAAAARRISREPSSRGRAAVACRRLLPLGAALALTLCGCRTMPPAASTPAAVLAATARATPALRFGPVEEFPGERLYNYMNGAAVTYLEHHLRTLAAGDVFRGADQAKIELYELASPADATRLYTALTASPGTAFAAGEAGCTWAGFEPEALFRRDRFLVRLLGYAKDRNAAASLLAEIAAALDGQLQRR